MSASTATAYPNSRASNSEKFSRIEQVRASDLPERYRTRLARLMEQFNFTGDELWMATDSCRVAIGKVCIRRKSGVIVRTRKGREEQCTLGPCDLISRRTVQRMLDELVEVFGVLEVLYEANQWVPYGGDVVFRHSRTYRLRTEKLKPQQTYKEWRMQQKAAHSVTEMPARKPAQAATGQGVDEAPPKTAESKESRKSLPITRDVRIAIAGCYANARKQGKDDEAAIAEVSESLSSERYNLAPSEARLQLKIWQSKHGSLDPPVKQERVEPAKCPDCQSVLLQNRGPGPRLICPKCSTGSS